MASRARRQYTIGVTAAPLVSIAVAPNPATLKVGQVQQFTATGTYADSSTADLTSQVTWTSDAPNVGHVDATGKATGKAAGSAHITATQGTVSGQATATVTPPVLTGVQPAAGTGEQAERGERADCAGPARTDCRPRTIHHERRERTGGGADRALADRQGQMASKAGSDPRLSRVQSRLLGRGICARRAAPY